MADVEAFFDLQDIFFGNWCGQNVAKAILMAKRFLLAHPDSVYAEEARFVCDCEPAYLGRGLFGVRDYLRALDTPRSLYYAGKVFDYREEWIVESAARGYLPARIYLNQYQHNDEKQEVLQQGLAARNRNAMYYLATASSYRQAALLGHPHALQRMVERTTWSQSEHYMWIFRIITKPHLGVNMYHFLQDVSRLLMHANVHKNVVYVLGYHCNKHLNEDSRTMCNMKLSHEHCILLARAKTFYLVWIQQARDSVAAFLGCARRNRWVCKDVARIIGAYVWNAQKWGNE